MENDSLIYIEGSHNTRFLTEKERDCAKAELFNDLHMSAGDFEGEFVEKFDILHERTKPKLGVFETNKYFEKLFPSFKIQKPGYDLYGKTTLFLVLLALFVFMFYGQMSVDQANYLKNSNSNIFRGDMVICLLVVILVIIVERYVGRTDTKAVTKQSNLTDTDKKFFDEQKFFRKQTSRSMSVKL